MRCFPKGLDFFSLNLAMKISGEFFYGGGINVSVEKNIKNMEWRRNMMLRSVRPGGEEGEGEPAAVF